MLRRRYVHVAVPNRHQKTPDPFSRCAGQCGCDHRHGRSSYQFSARVENISAARQFIDFFDRITFATTNQEKTQKKRLTQPAILCYRMQQLINRATRTVPMADPNVKAPSPASTIARGATPRVAAINCPLAPQFLCYRCRHVKRHFLLFSLSRTFA